MAKFKNGEIVTIRGHKHIIKGIKWYQPDGFAEDNFLVSYNVSPLELEGFEHDDDFYIFEETLVKEK